MVAPEPEAPFEVVITREEAGERLDRVLAARPLGLSRSTLKRWFDDGRVCVDGVVVTRGKVEARAGAVVAIRPAPPPPSAAAPQAIPLDVLYEDDDLVVVDKPAGLVVHPAPGHPDGTLVNAILHHFGVTEGQDPRRPGIVHRLDKDTSGVMVIARTAAARDGLVRLFQAHDIEREYRAIVSGHASEEATYDTLHGRHPKDRKRFTSRTTRGKRAVTHVVRKERLAGASLVACRLETGRTHQIRVHLSEHGHPILADPVYGGNPKDPRLKRAARAIGRQALHAAVLGFVHPVRGESMRFETPLPQDFDAALAILREA